MLLKLAYRLRRTLLAVLRWPTRGVKVMVFDPTGAMLLVRHSYGRTDLWMLPGGGIGRRETPADAARREVLEETGCALSELQPLGRFRNDAEGKRDTVHLFRGETSDAAVADEREIAEVRFCRLDALPPTVSAATLRRIAEVAGRAAPSLRW